MVQSNTEWHWACVSMKKIITKIIHLPFQRTTCFKIHTCYVHHPMWSLKNKLNSDFGIIVEHYYFYSQHKVWSHMVLTSTDTSSLTVANELLSVMTKPSRRYTAPWCVLALSTTQCTPFTLVDFRAANKHAKALYNYRYSWWQFKSWLLTIVYFWRNIIALLSPHE